MSLANQPGMLGMYNTLYERPRSAMLQRLERRGVKDRCVLGAMAVVPRELFVPANEVVAAYVDPDLEVLAQMIETLAIDPSDTVLEVGTGSGYSAAVLCQLASSVYTVERDLRTAAHARERLAILRYDSVTVGCHDGTLGWRQHAPYHAILIRPSLVRIPNAVIDQLAVGGRLVMIEAGEIVLVTKKQEHDFVVTWPRPCSRKSA
jgi:protein-L-isoaspartate(D-aspartate) O-methyltransferase